MCNFLSAIVRKNGDLHFNLWTDSHEDLIQLFALRDNREGNFARVEFTPKDPADLDKPEKYHLKIDEARGPDWFDESMKAKIVGRLRRVIESMIVRGEVVCLIGGVHILATGAKISFIKNCRIVAMLGSSNVGEMLGSSNVVALLDSSKVGEMRGSSNVGKMRGSSKVGEMWDRSNVG